MTTSSCFAPSGKFFRVSKYLLPADLSLLNLGFSLSACGRESLEQIAAMYPTKVSQIDMGWDQDWGGFETEYLHQGRLLRHMIASYPPVPVTIAKFQQFSTVGRECRVIAPHGSWLRERGYDLDQQFGAPGSAFSPRTWQRRLKSYVASHRRPPSATVVSGTAAILNNRSPHNFYHWLLEVVPRIQLLQQAGVTPDWYVLDSQSGFQKRVLSLLGIDLQRVIQPHCGLCLRPDELVRPSEPGAVATLGFAKQILEEVGCTSPSLASRRLYISRRNAAHRKVANEGELEEFLSRYGFETVDFGTLDFAEQVRLISSAEAIVAVHGAALANLIFARPATPVIEICPAKRYNLDCFPRLSHLCGLRHLSVLATSHSRRQSMQVDLSDMQLAIERLELLA